MLVVDDAGNTATIPGVPCIPALPVGGLGLLAVLVIVGGIVLLRRT